MWKAFLGMLDTVAKANEKQNQPIFVKDCFLYTSIVTICVCYYRRGMDWWMDLLTTYTHHSELQVITALSLIPILCKSSSACSVSNSRSLATAPDSGDFSAFRDQVLSSQSPMQNSRQLSTTALSQPPLSQTVLLITSAETT
jgi:hypothetical protein